MDLDRGIENKTPMDDLAREMASVLDYQDHITMWKSLATRLIERQCEQESERLRNTNANHDRLTEKLCQATQISY